MKPKTEFLFTADFQCVGCGSIIGVKHYLAAVKSLGVEVTCKHCKTTYLVTEEGAIPVASSAQIPQGEEPSPVGIPPSEDEPRL